jgi:hypothetical protein
MKFITFDYIGNYQTFVAPVSGTYNLELWGAQGGNTSHNAVGGKGAYSKGNVFLNKDQIIYVYVGGQNGYNGGGGLALVVIVKMSSRWRCY